MKIMVLNFSGNVGKSTISRHLLAPRLNDATVVPVETINSDENEETTAINGNQFSILISSMMSMDDDNSLIVDVGASNVERLLTEMANIKGSHEHFDYFIVPTVEGKKQQIDTIKTIQTLNSIGVPTEKIRLVFNQVEGGFLDTMGKKEVPRIFSALFDYYNDYQQFVLTPHAIVTKSELYELLKGKTIKEVIEDTTDFKAEIRRVTTREEKSFFSHQRITQMLANGVNPDLDEAFNALFENPQ